MAQFEQWFDQDFTEKIEIRHCESVMFSGDDQGAVVGVHLFNGGAEYAGGGTVSGKVIRSDGAEVALPGTISGNAASVVLLESCLAVPGPIGVYIRLTADSQKTTVLSAIYTVQATRTGTIVDPGTIIPSVNDLIDDIEQAVSSIPSDYTALLAAVAPTFSATAQYHAGYYVWYAGKLYQFTTNHDAGSWDATQAVKVPLSKAVGEMQDEARIYQYIANNGQYTITADDMENGAWSYSTKVNNAKRVRNANLIPVRAGMQISYSTPTLRLGFWVLASKTATGSFAQEIGFQAAGSSGTKNITADGYLIVLADSTNNITVADYDCKVTILSAIEGSLFSMYNPENSTFSVWDMPSLTYWRGFKSYFADSVDISNELTDNITYQIISIYGFIYIIDAVRGKFFIGTQRLIDHHQFWSDHSTYQDIVMMQRGLLPDATDINTVKKIGAYLINSTYTYSNSPFGSGLGGTLLVFPCYDTVILQLAISTAGITRARIAINNSFDGRQWREISGRETTNNYTFNEYQSTYNVTATPQITTDTNAYLAPSVGQADRTADIVTMLTSHGVCRLGKGDYYVNNLQMPDETAIIGAGQSTRIILSGTSDGYAIKMGSTCTVSNVAIYGAESNITPSENVGNRHGILWQGTYTQNQSAPTESIVSDVYIRNFSGGGITLYDTGYGTHNGLLITNADIVLCSAGINVAYWSEFNKFTNVRTMSCYYGCINNGGNNVFVNCDFSRCTLAMLMDNSQDQSPNNTHGSCIGCVFNHSGSNKGIGIRILNCKNGFIFSGCQIFFSKIDIVDSDGIVISDANIGLENCNVSISGGGAILFSNCMVQGTIPITVYNNSNVHFVNCYNRNTGAAWGI